MNCLKCNAQILNRSKKKPATSGKPKFCSHPCFISYYSELSRDITAERFWKKVTTNHFNSPFLLIFGCWRHKSDRRGGRRTWHKLYGPIPKGLCVLHHCDNPPCLNPFHLYLGSIKDNARDMSARGRQNGPRNESHHWSKLSNSQVLEIRAAWTNDCGMIPQLARDYGVSTMTIFRIVTRETWKHV
jgi:hypothetical protein